MKVDYGLLIDMIEHHRDSDRELDAMLFWATMPEFQSMGPMQVWLQTNASKSLAVVPNYTGSLDAAFGLLDRLMPNCFHAHRVDHDDNNERYYDFQVADAQHIHSSRAWTLPRACIGAAMVGYMMANQPAERDDSRQY